MEYSKRFLQRIVERTGLTTFEASIYITFVDNSSLDEPHIVYYASTIKDIQREYQNLGYEGVDKEKLYNTHLENFLDRELIGLTVWDGSNNIYPYIKGYNYYNDPKLYVASRKKGDDSWNGRSSTSLFTGLQGLKELTQYLNQNYEFREDFMKEKVWSLCN